MKDTGIVTIYDLKNDSAPLKCHKIDAKEFLSNDRWSVAPGEKSNALGNAEQFDVETDSGTAMQLKATEFKTLRTMAKDAGITDYMKMNKAALVAALEAK